MAELTGAQRRKLEELGREPISLPAEIYFAGNEQKQRENGTYNHPNLVKNRLRIAMDRLERARKEIMSDTEKAKIGVKGDNNELISNLEEDVRVAQKNLASVLGMKLEEEISSLNLSDKAEKKEEKKEEKADLTEEKKEEKEEDKVEDPAPIVKTVKKSPGRPKKATTTSVKDDLSSN